ncbi:MAG: hypothetical protein WCH82_10460, partial [Mycobacteriaceae bacterium]
MTVDRGARVLETGYRNTFRAPHGGASPAVPDALIAAHERLARRRSPGETLIGVYGADDAGGFGPALQIVTDQATMLMDSVTVLLHRLSVGYEWLMHPVLRVRRDADGTLLEVSPAGGASEGGASEG